MQCTLCWPSLLCFSRIAISWIDGRVFPLSESIEIAAPAGSVWQAWRVNSPSLALVAAPFAQHEDHTDLYVIRSDFVQLLGRASGTVELNGVKYVLLPGALAVVEKHDALW
jgi:hypothetical protein